MYFVCQDCWTMWLGNLDKCPACGSHNFDLDSEMFSLDDRPYEEDESTEEDDDQGSALQ